MFHIKNTAATGIPFKMGTENHGFLYESQVMTFLAGKFANDPTVSDFQMLTNPAEVNCFEDVLLRVEYKNGKAVMYVVQIKHSKCRLLIAKDKIKRSKCMTINLNSYYPSFKNIREMATTSSQRPLQKFLTSVSFENYYFCILTTISELDGDTKLNEIKISSNQDLELLNMGNGKNCYQLDRNVYSSSEYENLCCDEFASKFYIFLNQPNYSEIIGQLSGTSDAIKNFSQPMANDLVSLIKDHSVDSKAGSVVCNVLNKEKFAQLFLQVILCNSNMSIYTVKAKPIDEKYMKTWDKICSEYQFICIDEDRTDVLLPMLASYYEYRIRKYTEKALEKVLRVNHKSTEGQISLKNHQFTWDDRQKNGFQLDYWLREALKILGISSLNLRDLLPELWRRNEIPIIVETSVANTIMDMVDPNIKNRFFIVSSGNKPSEDGRGGFRNLLDLQNSPASVILPEIMNIELSLQGKLPVPLKDIVRGNTRILQLITSSDLLSWIARDSQDRKIGLPLKETVKSYVTRQFNIPSKNVAITEIDIVNELRNSNITIISNDPGMGKSTVLTSLARRCDRTRYVIIYDLAQCKMDLQDLTSDIHEDPIRYFYHKIQTEESALVEGILQQHIDEKNLVIFLDSFDEILPLHQNTVLNVVEKMLDMDAHVFITSRTQAEHLLISKFGNVISNYVNLSNLDSKDISGYLEKCQVPKNMWAKLPETFLSTPLHLQMLQEICKTGTEKDLEHMNETMLYRTFIDKKINLFYQKQKIYECNTHDVLSYLVDDILNKHCVIALVSLFGLEKIETLKIVTNKQWDDMLLTFVGYKLSLGIVSTINPIKFVHKTFAEYLAAVYITKNPEKCIELYKEVVTNIDLFQTYKFLHQLRSSDVTEEIITASITDGQEENILNIISASDTGRKLYKTWGMHPIHWAAVCCLMAIRSRTMNSKSFEILRLCLEQTSMNETAFDVGLKDKYLDWNWLNFLTGHDSINYNFFKHLILCLQTTTDMNAYLKSRIEENINHGLNRLGCLAVINSDKEVLDYLLNNTSELDYSGKDILGRNILHDACCFGTQEIVDFIIDSKPTKEFIEAQDNNGWNALHYACKLGNQKIVASLLERGLNINKKCKDGRSPFQMACERNETNLVKYLLELNANASRIIGNEQMKALHKASHTFNKLLKKKYSNPRQSNANELKTVHNASLEGNIQIIEALINMGFTEDDMDVDKKTPLRFACFKGIYKAEMYTFDKETNPPSIVKAGINELHFACGGEIIDAKDIEDFINDNRLIKYVECKDSTGMDALDYACRMGNKIVVEFLLKLGFYLNKNSYYYTPLHLACATNSIELVKYLLKSNADVNSTRGEDSKSALHEACLRGNLDVVKLLLEEERCEHTKEDLHGSRALHYAAKGGNVQIMEILVEMGMNLNKVNVNQETPLHYACAYGHFDAAKYLLDKGADLTVDRSGRNCLHLACGAENSAAKDIVDYLIAEELMYTNHTDRNRWDGLHYACNKGNREIAEFLLRHDIYIDRENMSRETPFHLACATNNVSLVKSLIENGANIEATSHGKTAVHFAAKGGNVDILEALIRNGLKSDVKDDKQETPLHLACRAGNYEAVAFLLDKGANPSAVNKHGDTTLHCALMGGNSDIVDLVLNSRNTVDVSKKGSSGRSPLHYAAENENVDVMVKLLARGADPDAIDNYLQTPLHLACGRRGHVETAKILMDANADVNMKSEYGSTPLHCAADTDNVDIVNELLARGANPNATDSELRVPLHLAIRRGCIKIIKILMELNEDIHVKDSNGQTLLHYATRMGNVDVVNELLAQGANPNAPDNKQQTPVHMAYAWNTFKVFKILLEANADVNIKFANGWSPLHYAVENEDADVVNKLLARGLNPNATDNFGTTSLSIACRRRNLEIVKILMEANTDLEQKDCNGYDVLYYAKINNDVKLIKLLKKN